jgi:hypothetical protein
LRVTFNIAQPSKKDGAGIVGPEGFFGAKVTSSIHSKAEGHESFRNPLFAKRASKLLGISLDFWFERSVCGGPKGVFARRPPPPIALL